MIYTKNTKLHSHFLEVKVPLLKNNSTNKVRVPLMKYIFKDAKIFYNEFSQKWTEYFFAKQQEL